MSISELYIKVGKTPIKQSAKCVMRRALPKTIRVVVVCAVWHILCIYVRRMDSLVHHPSFTPSYVQHMIHIVCMCMNMLFCIYIYSVNHMSIYTICGFVSAPICLVHQALHLQKNMFDPNCNIGTITPLPPLPPSLMTPASSSSSMCNRKIVKPPTLTTNM